MDLMLTILGKLLPGLVGRWLGTEIGVWHRPICRWLVRIAVARQPAEEQTALECEWLAMIDDLKSPTLQLLHAASFTVSALQVREAIVEDDLDRELLKKARIMNLSIAGLSAGLSTGFMTYHYETIRAHLLNLSPNSRFVLVATASLLSVVLLLVFPLIFHRSERAFLKMVKSVRRLRARQD